MGFSQPDLVLEDHLQGEAAAPPGAFYVGGLGVIVLSETCQSVIDLQRFDSNRCQLVAL